MTELEKAARQALEALEHLMGGTTSMQDALDANQKAKESITALRQALEQQPNRALVTCLFDAAAKSGNPKSIELAAQLSGVPPCEKCGYVIQHCRCPQPAAQHSYAGMTMWVGDRKITKHFTEFAITHAMTDVMEMEAKICIDKLREKNGGGV